MIFFPEKEVNVRLFEIGQEVYIKTGEVNYPTKGRVIGFTLSSDADSTVYQVRTGSTIDTLTEVDLYAIPSLQEIRDKKMSCFVEARCREDVVKMQKILPTSVTDPNYAIDIWDMNIGRKKYETAICFHIKQGVINGWCHWDYYVRDKYYGEGYLLKDILIASGEYASGGVVSYTLKAEDFPDTALPHNISIEIGNQMSTREFLSLILKNTQILTKENNKMKFKIGDKVIGNKEANSQYGVTREGWIGEVHRVLDNDYIEVYGDSNFGYKTDYTVDSKYFDLYTGNMPTKSHKLRFKITEGERYVSHGKHKGETIPTITTIAYDDTMGESGSATCDKADYNERQGIIEAVANMTYGNFDREYNKFLNHQKEVENALCKCSTCGKTYGTKEEARACEQAHIDRKKAKRENYLMRKAAKKRAREMQIEQMAKELLKNQTIS